MTTFLDGPAKGNTLMLKRTVIILRVTVGPTGQWDALDQVEDQAATDELIHVYVLWQCKGTTHIRAAKGRGGFYNMVAYKHLEPFLNQPLPPQQALRDNKRWFDWCDKIQPWVVGLLPPEIAARVK